MRDRIITAVCGCILAFLLSLSAVACLVTGFQMPVDLGTVALWCLGAAAFGAVFCTLPLQFVPLTAAGIIGVCLWFFGNLEASVAALLYRISRQYNSVYGWGILKLTHHTADDYELLFGLALCFIGAVIAILIARSVCCRKSALPGVLTAIACLAACLVVTTTVPDTIWLYLFLFSLLLLLLTQTVRRARQAEGNRLTLLAALPLALVLGILFLATPRDGYTGEELARTALNAILNNEAVQQVFGDLTPEGTSGSSVAGSMVRLDAVGVRVNSETEVFQVHTQYTGMLYLRGRALDSYDGLSWSDSGQGTPSLYWPSPEELTPLGEVTVQTRFAHMMLYLPYYVRSMNLADMTKGLANEKKLTRYSFSTGAMPTAAELEKLPDTGGDYSRYLHLSASVRQWAEPLSAEITAGKQTTYEKAQAIAEYVRSSGKYSLKTNTMPARERDFVKWFLEDSPTGYCVHFASSTAVLLQAAGIPARYVTGYLTPVGKDCYTAIREQDAHAWAEYWLPGFGWTVLEATPAAEPEQEETEESIPTPPAPVNKEINWEQVWILCGGILLSLIPLCFIQRILRRALRRRKLSTGGDRERLLAHWQEAVLLANCLGTEPDNRLREMAERAKFSPHTPTESEFAAFETYFAKGRKQLKRQNLFRRLCNYFVRAV